MNSRTPGRRRTVRSFVQRSRKLSPRQEKEFVRLWERFGGEIPESGVFHPASMFSEPGPITLEIGFGRGEALLAEACAYPEHRLLGIEVYRPGLHKVLRVAEEAGVANLRVLCADAAPLVARMPDACLACIRILFPDPWPKARHHKRRLLQKGFLAECARIAAPGAVLHIATDWQPYAQQIEELLATLGDWSREHPPARRTTHFEERGLRRGHQIHEWALRRPAT